MTSIGSTLREKCGQRVGDTVKLLELSEWLFSQYVIDMTNS